MYRGLGEAASPTVPAQDLLHPARGSRLELAGMMAGLNEVGARGESAYGAGFLTVDSATELREGREL